MIFFVRFVPRKEHMMITLYSTGCPKCNVLKAKLDSKNISYNYIEGDKAIEFAQAHNIMEMPIVTDNDTILNFMDANNLINSL